MPSFFRAAVLFALVSMAMPASADSIPAFKVSVDAGDADATACGLQQGSVEAALKSAMRYNRVSTSEDETAPLAVVSYTVVRPRSFCAVSVQLQLKKANLFSFGGRTVVGMELYCQRGAIMTNARNVRDSVLPWVKSAFDECLAEIDEYTIE